MIALAAACGYLLGSIPFGLLLLRVAGRPDPRSVGSGNIGATNVSRAGGRAFGAATLLLDAAKAAGPAAAFSAVSASAAAAAGSCAVVGHCFPVWLRFRGGKGVATLLGAGAVLAWPWALPAFAVTWSLVLLASRYVSVASLAGAWCLPVAALAAARPHAPLTAAVLAGCAVLVTVRHAGNLARLRRGAEPRALERRASREPVP